jgi:hypothetical protein
MVDLWLFRRRTGLEGRKSTAAGCAAMPFVTGWAAK